MRLSPHLVNLGILMAPILGACVTQAQFTIVLHPADDAYVNSHYPDANYGSETELFVHAGSNIKRTYLQFDLHAVPVDTVTGLSLRLLYGQAAPEGAVIDLHHVPNDNWDEASVTWQTMPSYTAAPLATASVQMGKADVIWTLPISLLHQDGDGRLSLLLKLADEGSSDTVNFFSKEATVPLAMAPELILAVPEPGPVTWVVGAGLAIWTLQQKRPRSVVTPRNSLSLGSLG